MTEQNKIILKDLVEQVKSGKITLDDLPLKWREMVEKELGAL